MDKSDTSVLERLEPFATGFLDADNEELSYRIACGMKRAAELMPLEIDSEVVLPTALWRDRFAVRYMFGGGIVFDGGKLAQERESHPEYSDAFDEIRHTFEPLRTDTLVNQTRTELQDCFIANNTGWGGTWGGHSNPDYQMLLELGTDGLRGRIARYETQHDASAWYAALGVALDALDTLGDRFAALYATQAESEADASLAQLYGRISKAFSVVPRRPARDFLEASCLFYMAFTFDGCDSPGRFDQFMKAYWACSDKADARRLLEYMWVGFHKTRSWNLCIGGCDAQWRDESNELTYAVLETAKKYGYNTPNLTLRCHGGMPESLRRLAAETIGTGIGMPALYNDEAVCPALEELGIAPEDAHNYCMNGCNQIDIQGKSHMGLEDGELSLIKCLEYALHDGKCLHTGKQIGLRTGDASCFQTFSDVFNAFKMQIKWGLDEVVDMANKAQRVYGEHAPNPLRSNLLRGCVESGRDYKCGGPVYNHGQILTEGLADAVDSLAAIKHFVFDTGEVGMEELVEALRTDFAGKEALRLKLRRYEGKFGNDIAEVDEIAREVIGFFFGTMSVYRTWRDSENGIYGGGLSTFNRTGRYGSTLGATAAGHHAGDPNLADSIGAVPGCDVNGPTSLVKSALAYDHRLAKSGFVLQLKFDKALFNSEAGLSSFLSLWKTYFSGGGQQLSINVLSQGELLEAQKNPDAYGNLIVRVGGYSDYFVKLPVALQNNIIQRTMY